MRSVLGPGIDSARSNSPTCSRWQKYGPLCSSCSSTSRAPAAAASRRPASIASRFASRLPRLVSCSSATLSVLPVIACLLPWNACETGSLAEQGGAVVAKVLLRGARSAQQAGRQLHGDAVQAAVLPDQRAAGHLHHFAARISDADDAGGLVVGRIAV